MSLDQAQHNESVCQFLLIGGKYNDWVVTTAFYSALHYVEHQIFPLVVGAITYNTFKHYFDGACSSNHQSKHKIKSSLVKSQLTCGSEYRWLMDECMNARYIDYVVDKDTANMANKCLKKIKRCIIKK